MIHTNFSIEERNTLIANIWQLRKIVIQLASDLEDAPEEERLQSHLTNEYNKALDELKELEDIYIANLPRKTISRCPFSNEAYSLSIDIFGLDGFWWDAIQAVRTVEEEGKTFFALTGSVNITGSTPEVKFSIKPGPPVPWVCPRLLANENITAVLSLIKIGEYDAYVVVYYSKDKSIEIERINTWGTNYYIAEDTEGLAVMGSTFDEEEEYDFDIAKWITKGKLKWIDIGDDSLSLQGSLDNCPFLNLSGHQYPVLIQNKTSVNCMISLEYEDNEEEEIEIVNVKSKFCTNCGTAIKEGSKFCANCGNKLN